MPKWPIFILLRQDVNISVDSWQRLHCLPLKYVSDIANKRKRTCIQCNCFLYTSLQIAAHFHFRAPQTSFFHKWIYVLYVIKLNNFSVSQIVSPYSHLISFRSTFSISSFQRQFFGHLESLTSGVAYACGKRYVACVPVNRLRDVV